MLTIHVLPRRLKEFLLTHPLYKSPNWYLCAYFWRKKYHPGRGRANRLRRRAGDAQSR